MQSSSNVRRSALILRLVFAALVVAMAAASAAACGSDESASGGGTASGDGGAGSPPDPLVGADGNNGPTTVMRVAHLGPDMGPIDFCYRTAKASSYEGPVLSGGIGTIKRDAGSDADASDAIADDAEPPPDAGDGGSAESAIAYGTVSRYLTLTASGPMTIALVAPGSTSCATPLFTDDVTLDPGKLSTVVLLGWETKSPPPLDAGSSEDASADAAGPVPADARTELALLAFIDDRATQPNKSRVRVIHAALGAAGGRPPSDSIAVRAAAAQTVELADRVEPRRAASPSLAIPVDALGYATIDPLASPARLAASAPTGTSADASVDSWVSESGELGLRGGSLHTAFVLSGASGGFEVLWCADTSTTGERTTCSLIR